MATLPDPIDTLSPEARRVSDRISSTIAGILFAFDTPLPEGARAPF
jgi:hypothetical protein